MKAASAGSVIMTTAVSTRVTTTEAIPKTRGTHHADRFARNRTIETTAAPISSSDCTTAMIVPIVEANSILVNSPYPSCVYVSLSVAGSSAQLELELMTRKALRESRNVATNVSKGRFWGESSVAEPEGAAPSILLSGLGAGNDDVAAALLSRESADRT
jgi:hypothetical protein